jgi:peptide/nickel transport system substrate-binding protein
MAVDREAIVRDYYGGDGEVLNFPLLKEWKDVYTPIEELPPDVRENYKYNPDKAKQLLKDAGYPNGFKTEMVLQNTQTTMEAMQIVQDYWSKIGVICELKPIEYGTLVTMTYGKSFPQIDCIGAGATIPFETMLWKSTGQYYNYEFFSNPTFDARVAEMIGTLDETKRMQIIKESMIYYMGFATHFAFPASQTYYFWHPWLKNYSGENVLGNTNFGGLQARVWIDQNLKKKLTGR